VTPQHGQRASQRHSLGGQGVSGWDAAHSKVALAPGASSAMRPKHGTMHLRAPQGPGDQAWIIRGRALRHGVCGRGSQQGAAKGTIRRDRCIRRRPGTRRLEGRRCGAAASLQAQVQPKRLCRAQGTGRVFPIKAMKRAKQG